jgi:hypothetical protein
MASEFIIRINPRIGERYDRHYQLRKDALAAFWVEVKTECPDEARLHQAVNELAFQCLGRPMSGTTEQLIEAINAAYPEFPPSSALFFSFASGDRMVLHTSGS